MKKDEGKHVKRPKPLESEKGKIIQTVIYIWKKKRKRKREEKKGKWRERERKKNQEKGCLECKLDSTQSNQL